MKFGYLSVNTATGMLPAALGRELEARRFESLWVPEHSHIPIRSVGDYPGEGPLPDGYVHALNPFVALSAVASTTTRLNIATGVCLPLEHDLVDLACTTASLDVLSQGRFIMGAGVGWNAEQLANSRNDIPFNKRYTAFRETIQALRAAWGSSACDYQGLFSDTDWGRQISAFQGTYQQLSNAWVFPKPFNGSIPVALGMSGPLGLRHVVEYADIWLPVDIALRNTAGEIDVAGHVSTFRRQLEAAGKPLSSVPITLFVWSDIDAGDIEQYISLGIERIVFSPPSFHRHDADATRTRLDQLGVFLERYATD